MILRKYQKADNAEIVNLFFNTVHSVNTEDYTEDQLKVWAPDIIDTEKWCSSLQKDYTIVAEMDGTIVGFANVDATGYFDRLYVHKDFQGRGIATQLSLCVEEYAHKSGFKELTADVSITAKPFFIKQGYLMLRENDVERDGQHLVNYKMKKTL